MKPTSEILERIEKCSTEHQDGVCTKLYRNLMREDIYYANGKPPQCGKGLTPASVKYGVRKMPGYMRFTLYVILMS